MGKYMDSGGLSHLMSKIKSWANGAFLKLSGGTMTGKLTLKAEQTADSYTGGALDAQNSNIVGINSIYTADSSDSAQEGIHFYRDATHVDSIHARLGELYFTPYRQLGTVGIPQRVSVEKERSNGTPDYPFRTNVDSIRANKFMFLPADQIIIEKTTDGGQTWVDAGISDNGKVGLFSETRPSVPIPLLNGVKSPLCGVRITITGMKYDIPEGTSETDKYQYWNSDHVLSTERYCSIDGIYIWDSANTDKLSVKYEVAAGNSSDTWYTRFDSGTSFGLTGWSGSNHFKLNSYTLFGGGTGQTGNTWNHRLTFFTIGPNYDSELAPTYTTASQVLMEIRAYGENSWTQNDHMAFRDHIYTWDWVKNVSFPGHIYPAVNNAKSLGASTLKWNSVYATTFYGNVIGDVSGNITAPSSVATPTLTAGKRASSSDYPSGGMHVWDIRNVPAYTPYVIPEMSANFLFSNSYMPTANWWSVLNVKGWSGNYATWQLAGYADSYDSDAARSTPLYIRNGNYSTWGDWRKIFDDAQTIPISNGGTGATTAAAAWTALGGGAIGKKASLAASDIPAHASTATTYGAASTTNYGHAKLSSATNSSAEDLAATPMAVKAAYDLATTANTNAGSAMSAATGAYVLNVTYAISDGTVTCSAHVYSAGSEVTSTFADSCFTWSYNTGAGWVATSTHAKTYTPSVLSAFGGSVKCDFTPPSN